MLTETSVYKLQCEYILSISHGYIPRIGTAELHGSSMFNFFETLPDGFPKCGCTILHSQQQYTKAVCVCVSVCVCVCVCVCVSVCAICVWVYFWALCSFDICVCFYAKFHTVLITIDF